MPFSRRSPANDQSEALAGGVVDRLASASTLPGRAIAVIRLARLTGRPYQSPPRGERRRRGRRRRAAAGSRRPRRRRPRPASSAASSSGVGVGRDEHRRVADHLHQPHRGLDDRRARARRGGPSPRPAPRGRALSPSCVKSTMSAKQTVTSSAPGGAPAGELGAGRTRRGGSARAGGGRARRRASRPISGMSARAASAKRCATSYSVSPSAHERVGDRRRFGRGELRHRHPQQRGRSRGCPRPGGPRRAAAWTRFAASTSALGVDRRRRRSGAGSPSARRLRDAGTPRRSRPARRPRRRCSARPPPLENALDRQQRQAVLGDRACAARRAGRRPRPALSSSCSRGLAGLALGCPRAAPRASKSISATPRAFCLAAVRSPRLDSETPMGADGRRAADLRAARWCCCPASSCRCTSSRSATSG